MKNQIIYQYGPSVSMADLKGRQHSTVKKYFYLPLCAMLLFNIHTICIPMHGTWNSTKASPSMHGACIPKLYKYRHLFRISSTVLTTNPNKKQPLRNWEEYVSSAPIYFLSWLTALDFTFGSTFTAWNYEDFDTLPIDMVCSCGCL